MILTKRKAKKKTRKSIKKPYKTKKERKKSKKKQIGGHLTVQQNGLHFSLTRILGKEYPCHLQQSDLDEFIQNIISNEKHIDVSFMKIGSEIVEVSRHGPNIFKLNENAIIRTTKMTSKDSVDAELKGLKLQKSIPSEYVCNIYYYNSYFVGGFHYTAAIIENCTLFSDSREKNILAIKNLLEGILYLHRMKIMRNNLKEENITKYGKMYSYEGGELFQRTKAPQTMNMLQVVFDIMNKYFQDKDIKDFIPENIENPIEEHINKLINNDIFLHALDAMAQSIDITEIIQKIKRMKSIKKINKLEYGDYKLKYLGEGTYNTVFRISFGNTNLILRYTKKDEESNIDTEMKGLVLQKSLDYVCKIYRIEVIEINGKRCCVAIMEECESVSKIQNKNLFIQHLLEGIDYLQQRRKIHLDIKADNLSWDGKKIKFLDFGCIEEAGRGKETICMPLVLQKFPYHWGEDDEMKTHEESLSAYTMLSGVFMVMLEIFEDGPIIKQIAKNYKNKMKVPFDREAKKREKKTGTLAALDQREKKGYIPSLQGIVNFKKILEKEEKLFNIMTGALHMRQGPSNSMAYKLHNEFLTLFMKSIQEEISQKVSSHEMDFLQKLIGPLFLEAKKTHFDKKVMSEKIEELIKHPFLNR